MQMLANGSKEQTLKQKNQMNEEHMLEYNEEQFPQEEFDINTLKMLDTVCEGIEVPTDEESAESAREHHGDISAIGQNSIDPDSHPSNRHPNGWVMPHQQYGE